MNQEIMFVLLRRTGGLDGNCICTILTTYVHVGTSPQYAQPLNKRYASLFGSKHDPAVHRVGTVAMTDISHVAQECRATTSTPDSNHASNLHYNSQYHYSTSWRPPV